MIGTLGGLRVVDGLLRLRHHLVVGRDDEDDEVRNLGTAGTHGGERLVTRRVEEGDRATVFGLDGVGADVLRDAARLARSDTRFADVVEKRRLAVVDVAHDRDDGRTGDEIFGIVLVDFDVFHPDIGHELDIEAVLVGDEGDGVGVEALVDGDHHAEAEPGLNNVGRRHVHHRGELAGRDELHDAELALLLAQLFHLALALLGALLAAVATALLARHGRSPARASAAFPARSRRPRPYRPCLSSSACHAWTARPYRCRPR